MLEKQLGDWKQSCEELAAEVEGCQKESRQHAAELFKLKTVHEESLEQMEVLRRENKAYQGTTARSRHCARSEKSDHPASEKYSRRLLVEVTHGSRKDRKLQFYTN